MQDLIIVGGGPAGLAAAAHAAELRVDFLLLSEDLGGKCNYGLTLPGDVEKTDAAHAEIDGDSIVTSYQSVVENLPHSYRLESIEAVEYRGGRFLVTTGHGTIEQSRTLIIATGAGTRRLNVPGELKYLSRGLGYSSRPYARLLTGRNVFLAGDSDRVLFSAQEIASRAASVTVVLLEGFKVSRCALENVCDLANAHVILDATLERISGGEFPQQATVSAGAETQEVRADAFFIETELRGNTGLLPDARNLREGTYIAASHEGVTVIPGLFAAGDVTGHSCEQPVAAIGQGVAALHHAREYLASTAGAAAGTGN